MNSSRKRPRIASEYSSAEIPASVHNYDSDQEKFEQPGVTISTEFDAQKLIQNVFLSAADSTTTHNDAQNDQLNMLLLTSAGNSPVDIRSTTIKLIEPMSPLELVDLCNPLMDLEFDKLETDSVSVRQQANAAPPLCMSERFLMQMLKKIWPVVASSSVGADGEQTKKREFLQDIFKQAYYNGER